MTLENIQNIMEDWKKSFKNLSSKVYIWSCLLTESHPPKYTNVLLNWVGWFWFIFNISVLYISPMHLLLHLQEKKFILKKA